MAAVREEIGRDRFLLACWGVRPELVGLVDGCRLGTDGFSYAGLAQFNSFNNVVWRNDPDHIELSEKEAWRSTMVTSLTGSLFLLTDKPERYRTAFVEPARRAAPVLVTVPGQLYDVDPSRSSELGRVDAEVSGRDPKPFDAGLDAVGASLPARDQPAVRVVGRARPDGRRVRRDPVGGPRPRPGEALHGVRVLGAPLLSRGRRVVRARDRCPPAFNSQVFVIRERLPHPQVVATSRHITGGGVDLLDVAWKDGVLSGRSLAVGGEAYEIYMTTSAGAQAWRLAEVQCGAGIRSTREARPPLVVATCLPTTSGEIAWRARFEPVRVAAAPAAATRR